MVLQGGAGGHGAVGADVEQQPPAGGAGQGERCGGVGVPPEAGSDQPKKRSPALATWAMRVAGRAGPFQVRLSHTEALVGTPLYFWVAWLWVPNMT